MILASTADLKKYVAVADSFEFSDFEPYIKKAINKFTSQYVGNLHIMLADAPTSGDGLAARLDARELLREALTNYGLFLYLPMGQVLFDSTGVAMQENANRKQVDNFTANDLRRDFLNSGGFSLDRLLEVLEANPTTFTDWTARYLTVNQELLVSNTDTFDKYFNIFRSRQTYLALQPTIRKVEDAYLYSMFCPELIAHLKSASLTEQTHKDVKKFLQQAVVSYTVAKVADEGLFLLDASGLRIKFDTLPHETNRIPDYGKQADQVTRMVKAKESDGDQYIKLAVDIIKANPSKFDQCNKVLINEDKDLEKGFPPYNSKGVLGL